MPRQQKLLRKSVVLLLLVSLMFSLLPGLAAGASSYFDANLLPGKQYEYALQSIDGTLQSLPTEPVSYTVPDFGAANLAWSQTSYTVEFPGQPVELTAVLTDGDDDPIVGSTVKFELQGDYVGTYIESEIGEVETDVNGVASLIYTPPFAGLFEVRASTEPNDDDLLDGAEAIVTLDVQQPQWGLPPLLMRVTDAVKPGMLFQLSGHAIIADDWDDVKVVVEPLASSSMTPSAEAIELEIVQKDELRGQFMHMLFPTSVSPGSYRLWVSNEQGWSEPIELNSPRPLFISEYEVFDGLSIDISGRNFQAREFDANTETKVRLRNGSGVAIDVPITDLTPYSLRFLVDGVPLGEYDVQVSNDGGHSWKSLQSDQTLTVVSPGEDPLGLGVAWADHFDWDNVFDVTDYGAIADDGNDDTAAIAAAVAAAKNDGGGVVYLPAGTFHASVVQLPSHIVLMGDGPESTFLYHIGNNQNFIQAISDGKTEGRMGIARIGIRAADDTMYPDAFIWLGHDWGAAVEDLTLRTASEIFVVETSIEYPALDPVDRSRGGGRGQGMIFVGDERLIIKDNRMVGWVAQYNRVFMNRYVNSIGNYAEYSSSAMPITADYTFIRDNEFVMRGEADVEVHGIGMKSNSHVENNIVRTTGAHLKTTYNNDGESIFAEMPNAYYAVGEVLGATADTISLAPSQPLPEPISLRTGRLTVVIVDGTGLGQYREVQYMSGTTYSLMDEWDVIPDRTSKFALIAPNDNMTVYNNEAIDGQRGIWLYGNAIDVVVADNKLVNTDGIYIYSSTNVNNSRYTPTFFVNVKGNQLIGTPGTGHASGIITVSNRRGLEMRFYATGVYGIEINDNYLYGSQEPISTPRHQKFSGIVSSAATHSSDSNPVFTLEDRDNLNVIISNNRLEHMADGLVLMNGLYGHTARGNHFTDVVRELYEFYGQGTSRLLQLPGAFTDKRAPYWPTWSKMHAELSANDTAELSWDPAADIVGVTQYRIYQNGVQLDTVSGGLTTYETATLQAGTTYRFQVTALDAAGNESYSALEAIVQTPGNPGPGPGSGPGSGWGSIIVPHDQQVQAQQDGSVSIVVKPTREAATGLSVSAVTKALLDEALELAQPGEHGAKVIRIHLESDDESSGYAVDLPMGNVCESYTSGGGIVKLEVQTEHASVQVPCTALRAASDSSTGEVRLTIAAADRTGWSSSNKLRIGSRPALEVSLSADARLLDGRHGDEQLSVSIPYEPSEAERAMPGNIVIWKIEGNSGKAVINGRYDTASGSVIFKASDAGVYAVGFERKSFADTEGLDWAKRPIETLAARGIINGTAEDVFTPNASVKRADFVLMLMRLLEPDGDAGEPFLDTDPDSYYYDAVSKARAYGIVNGGANNRFHPNEEISRQDMMVMTARALRLAGLLATGDADGNTGGGEVWAAFSDSGNVASYAREDIAALLNLGLIQGSAGQLQPLKSTSRAQAAVLIHRLFELLL